MIECTCIFSTMSISSIKTSNLHDYGSEFVHTAIVLLKFFLWRSKHLKEVRRVTILTPDMTLLLYNIASS